MTGTFRLWRALHRYIRRTSVVGLTTAPRLAFNPLHVIECPPPLISANTSQVFSWRLDFLRDSPAGCNVLARARRDRRREIYSSRRGEQTFNGHSVVDPTKSGATKDAGTRGSRVLARLSADCDRWLEENTPSLLFFVLELSGSRPSHAKKKETRLMARWRIPIYCKFARQLVELAGWLPDRRPNAITESETTWGASFIRETISTA